VTFTVVARGEPGYPPRLASIFDPPRRLYLRAADAGVLGRPAVAVVGARACSDYGAHVAFTLARTLAEAGALVVSGLARGIDAAAHRGALDSGGATAAVLGCGIDRDYPSAHAALARRIAESGAIVSEYPPGVEPAPWRFPARNRIIAGLSQAVVVVEARERSGALITADFALEEGREVLAVPGQITSALSAGTNALLRHGAAPALSADDVLAVLGLESPPARPDPKGEDGTIVALLRESPMGIDGLVRATGLPTERVAAVLVRLELDGLVRVADGVYRPAG
jgi:DNA processing protein